MAQLELGQRLPRHTGSRLLRAVAQARRFPLLPLSVLLSVLIIPAIFANQLAPYDPLDGSLSDRLLPPFWLGEQVVVVDGEEIITRKAGSTEHLLGTDKQGRDMLSRILYGAWVSLRVSLISIFFAGLLGISLGLMAGYFGGMVDHVIMRLVDIALAIPGLLLAMVLVTALGNSFETVIAVIALLLWARYARMIRGESLSIKSRDFVARARVAGASDFRIITVHIFPNVVNTAIVLATLEIGHVILIEATLSFLGAGIPKPTPAWGLMISDGRELIVAAWWVSFFPGLAMLLTVLSMNLIGDWLRDRLDPKLRQV